MESSKISEFTRTIRSSGDMKGYCGVLYVRDEHTVNYDPETGEKRDFGNFMTSAWKPSSVELEALLMGASIILRIRGEQHPVVSLGIGE